MEDARREWSKTDFFPGDPEHCHRLVMLCLHILKLGVFLIIGERNAQNIRVFGDLVEQRAAAQFNVIRVRAEKKDTLTKKFQKEMNAGIASLVLLSVLENSSEPTYGYQISKLVEEYSGDAAFMKQGALYPVLHSLENSGLLDSRVEPSVSGPPRRYYEITTEGREALVTWQGVWKQMKSFVDRAIKGG